MAQILTGGRFVWWSSIHSVVAPVHAAGLGLVVVVVPVAGAVRAGALGAAPDLVPGLVPVITREAVVPAPGQVESHDPTLVHVLVNPGPAQETGSPPPKFNRNRIYADLLKKSLGIESPTAVHLLQLQMERRFARSNLLLNHHPHKLMTTPSLVKNAQVLADHSLVPGLDQPPRISEGNCC